MTILSIKDLLIFDHYSRRINFDVFYFAKINFFEKHFFLFKKICATKINFTTVVVDFI